LLDRLLDDHPDRAQDRPQSPSETIAAVRNAVHRDIEHLLNARRPWRSLPWRALENSPLGYGISDFTAGAFNEGSEQERFRIEIQEAIRRFEPRLAQVQVRIASAPTPTRAVLKLHIDALLLIDPMPEPISFDTLVDTTRADVVLRPAREG
jgi:type VI secretion system protein ImpF